MEKDFSFIIDLDGVIIDSVGFWQELANGYNLDDLSFYNGLKKIDELNKTKLSKKIIKTCIDFYSKEANLCIGVNEFLAKFKAYKKCIYTASPFAKLVLKRFDILDEFTFIQDERKYLKTTQIALKTCMNKLNTNKFILIDDSFKIIDLANKNDIFSIGINCENAKINIKNIGELNEKDIKYSWK